MLLLATARHLDAAVVHQEATLVLGKRAHAVAHGSTGGVHAALVLLLVLQLTVDRQLLVGLGVSGGSGERSSFVTYQVLNIHGAGVRAVDRITMVLRNVVHRPSSRLQVWCTRERCRCVESSAGEPVIVHADLERGAIEVVEILKIVQVL